MINEQELEDQLEGLENELQDALAHSTLEEYPAEMLCPRYLAEYLPGVRIQGVLHRFTYMGAIPCTGVYRCMLCGAVVN